MAGLPVQLSPDDPLVLTLSSSLGASGTPGQLSALSFCHWASPEHGNTSELVWNAAFQAAQIGIAIFNAIQQAKIADMQLDLGEKWFSHADYKWQRFNNNYRPLEEKLVAESMRSLPPKLDCIGAERLAEHNVLKSKSSWKTNFKLCHKLNTSLKTAALLVDSENYCMADDRWYRDFKDDQRWGRRSQLANLGRNTSAQVLAYGDVANKTLGQVAGHWNTFATAATQALGYFGARHDTYMPHTYLGTGGQSSTNLISIGKGTGTVNPNSLGATP